MRSSNKKKVGSLNSERESTLQSSNPKLILFYPRKYIRSIIVITSPCIHAFKGSLSFAFSGATVLTVVLQNRYTLFPVTCIS